MITIFLRTLIFYILIILSMHFTGKRQVGQLELSELVTAFMLSEVASIPITDLNIPIFHAVIPIIVISSLEIIFSYLSMKSDFFRRLTVGVPSPLVKHGKINIEAMRNSRITMNELLSAMRTNGIGSLTEVDYIYIEPSGNISVIAKSSSRALCPDDIGVNVDDSTVEHAVIIDKRINHDCLKEIGKTEKWVNNLLKKHSTDINDVFYMGADDSGNVNIVKFSEVIKKE